MRFRETLWFMKGVLDAEVAQRRGDGEDIQVAVDSLPIEDRYLDDGTLQPGDTEEFGLHTGTTQGLPRLEEVANPGNAGIPEHVLINEMKRGRRIYLATMAGAAAVLGCALVLLV